MLGPLTIVSLDQGKLYGKSTQPEQTLWWQPAVENDIITADSASARGTALSRVLTAMGLWIMRFRAGFTTISGRGLTGH